MEKIIRVILGLVCFALLFLLFRFLESYVASYVANKRRRRNYLHKQSNRTPLSDEEFCQRVGLDPSIADFVHIIRHNLAEDSWCDPLRIYPDDHFEDDFGWYGHENWERLEYDMDFYNLCGARSHIGEFILEVVKRKKESEQWTNEAPPKERQYLLWEILKGLIKFW